MSQNAAVKAFREMTELYGNVDFEAALRDLRAEVATTDSTLLLASFVAYGLMKPLGVDSETSPYDPILQHHIELLQALTLMGSGIGELVVPPIDGKLSVLLRQVDMSAMIRRFNPMEGELSGEEGTRLFLQEVMRGRTQAVRNWAYPQQIIRILTDLFAPLENEIERALGIQVGHLVRMFVSLEEECTRRVNAHNDRLRPMLQAKSVAEAFAAYYREMPNLVSLDLETVQKFERGMDVETAQAALFSHSQLLLPEAFTISLEDALGAYPGAVELDALKRALDALSQGFGDLADENPEHIILSNPVWTHPFILLDDGRYFWPVLTLLYAFGLHWMEGLLACDKSLKAQYEQRRAFYLEEETVRLVQAAFPGAQVFRGSLWEDPASGKTYENDVLVVIDTFLVLLEAKSARLNEAARRGAPGSLKTKLKELIVEPAEQSERFVEFLRAKPCTHQFPTKRGILNKVDTTTVRHFVRLNVTFESLSYLGTRHPELQKAGLIKVDKVLPPTIAIAELEMAFEILEGVCQKLHYLARRAEFERNAVYLGDECDLLAYYLDTGFNIGQQEFSGEPLFLWTLAKALDPYFMQSITGENAPKPQLRLTPWWRDMLTQIEARRPRTWAEVGYTLLSLAHDDQRAFEADFRLRCEAVRHHGMASDRGGVTLFDNGLFQRRVVIIGMPYKGQEREGRNDLIYAAGAHIMEEAGVGKCIVIGLDVERDEYPYSVLACLFSVDDLPSV